MRTIYKYPLGPDGRVELPMNASVLTVQAQHGEPMLWAVVDTEPILLEVRRYLVIGTGHELPNNLGRYVATFQLHGGALVFHVFEVTP